MDQQEYKTRCLEAATKVQLLLEFAGSLIGDLDIIKETMELAEDRSSTADSTAILIDACGGNYRDIKFNADLKKRRAQALYNLINCIAETEAERKINEQNNQDRANSMQQLKELFGG